MAHVNTELKRSSIVCLNLPFGRTLPPPHISLTGPISAQDRAHLSRVYPGFWTTGDESNPHQTLVLVTAMNATTVVFMPPLRVR